LPYSMDFLVAVSIGLILSLLSLGKLGEQDVALRARTSACCAA